MSNFETILKLAKIKPKYQIGQKIYAPNFDSATSSTETFTVVKLKAIISSDPKDKDATLYTLAKHDSAATDIYPECWLDENCLTDLAQLDKWNRGINKRVIRGLKNKIKNCENEIKKLTKLK